MLWPFNKIMAPFL